MGHAARRMVRAGELGGGRVRQLTMNNAIVRRSCSAESNRLLPGTPGGEGLSGEADVRVRTFEPEKRPSFFRIDLRSSRSGVARYANNKECASDELKAVSGNARSMSVQPCRAAGDLRGTSRVDNDPFTTTQLGYLYQESMCHGFGAPAESLRLINDSEAGQ
jgi:hypothetical protein